MQYFYKLHTVFQYVAAVHSIFKFLHSIFKHSISRSRNILFLEVATQYFSKLQHLPRWTQGHFPPSLFHSPSLPTDPQSSRSLITKTCINFREEVKYYFADFVRKRGGGRGTPQIRNCFFAENIARKRGGGCFLGKNTIFSPFLRKKFRANVRKGGGGEPP